MPGLLLSLVMTCGLCGQARANEVEAAVRYYFADSVFPANDFSGDTYPGASVHKTQIRLTGLHDLWGGFKADYDLRYGFAYSAKTVGGMRMAATSSGMEDEKIGLRHSLGQIGDFSQAARLSVVIPGGADKLTPSLGSGQWAVEPTYFIGFDPGFWNLHAGFDIGSRVFLDGGSAQLRVHFQVSAPVTDRLSLAAEVSFRRSMLFSAFRPVIDDGELNNLLRPGIEARYKLDEGLESVMAYQVYAAGMDGRAYQRVIAGLAITY